MPAFRRGFTAEGDSKASNFKPFAPQISWKEDNEEKHLLFLTNPDETYEVDLHEWIPVEVDRGDGEEVLRWEWFIARTDDGIGEDSDPLEDNYNLKTRRRVIGIAVELEPVLEVVKGRRRPTGFKVATGSYNKKGEEVVYPKIGVVIQSESNFWGWLGSYDRSKAPVTETPMQVTRRGKDTNTNYDFLDFENVEVDLKPLFESAENIGYLSDRIEEVQKDINAKGDDFEKALALANAYLTKRIDEWSDGERYANLTKKVVSSKISPYARKQDEKKAKPETKAEAKPSQESKSQMDHFAELRQEVEGAGTAA